jgi:hypothetical protein
MDTRNRAREDEKGIVLDDWIESLEDLGIDTTKALKEERALIAKSNQLGSYYQQYKGAQEAGPAVAARKLADPPDDYEQFALALATAAITSEPAVQDRAAKIIEQAYGIARRNAFNHFRHRGDGAYKLIASVFNETRDGITAAGSALPEGVVDLDSAARTGVEQQWLRLEALLERWDTMLQLIEAWYVNGVFDTDGRHLENYNVWMFVHGDYEQAVNTYGVGVLRTVRQVINCDTRLLTIAEVDELESTKAKKATPDEQRAANARQQQADAEANAILRAEWEAQGVTPRLVAASAKRSR